MMKKEKEEVSAQGATSKNKKKKKKKKKQNEESDSAVQDTEIMDKEPRIEFKDVPQARPQPVRIISALAEKPSEPKEFSKPVEETRARAVFTESSVSVTHNISEKGSSKVQQSQETSTSNTKQNSVPPPSQAKSEESWESPKQVKKKKKARRET
ncbi:protein LYRIC [Bombina bombina]|uniref:protein LYRIC n=1 Tax=Bombina bombina TaxID=8345 RepID=UPI00235A5E72|nr:protein LYRIC [Bombina bombina]